MFTCMYYLHTYKGFINFVKAGFRSDLARSVECVTANINTQGLKQPRNEGTSFVLQTARPLNGSDHHVKWRFRLY